MKISRMRAVMKPNNIIMCPLYGGDYIVSVNISMTKDELQKIGLKTREEIEEYIKKKLDS